MHSTEAQSLAIAIICLQRAQAAELIVIDNDNDKEGVLTRSDDPLWKADFGREEQYSGWSLCGELDGGRNPRGVHGGHCRDPPILNDELDIAALSS